MMNQTQSDIELIRECLIEDFHELLEGSRALAALARVEARVGGLEEGRKNTLARIAELEAQLAKYRTMGGQPGPWVVAPNDPS